MKKYYLVIISILITVFSFGQSAKTDTISENKKFSKIRLTPFISYDFNLSNEIYNHNYNFSGTTYFTYEKVNYRAGFEVDYFINENISVSTGVNYSNKDYESWYTCESCFSPSFEYVKLRFIDVPIYGSYHVIFNKFNIFGQLGIINHFTLNREVHYNDQEVTLEYINEYYLSGKIGLGVSYPINRHRLFIASDYITGVSNIFEKEDYKIKTLGIRMGIQFLL